jgi:hypothetical protein
MYAPNNMSMARALTGTLEWASGEDKEKALEEFRAGADGHPADRWNVWNKVRAGQLLDLLGRRAEAVSLYKAAYADPDKWDFKSLIKACMAKPCGAPDPGLFSPN